MNYMIHAVYSVIAHFPGLAARTHRPCGRMKMRLQMVMASTGSLASGCALLLGIIAWRGFRGGDFGYFPVVLLGAVAVFLLLGGAQAILRALINPAPPVPENVIPFRRPAQASRLHAYRDHY